MKGEEWRKKVKLPRGALRYTLSNKNPSAWNFLSPAQAVTWRTVAIIIRVVLLSPYLCICGISLSSINPEVSGGRIPLQDKYSHKSEPHWDYVEWGEKDNAENPACPPSQKQRWAMGPSVRRVGWSCFISALPSIIDWVHDTMNEISGRNRRVLDFIKAVNFWK